MKINKQYIKVPSLLMIYYIFIGMAALILPVILIPLIKFSNYSEVVEEIAKVLVVIFLIFKLPTFSIQVLAGVGFGFLFGLSENLLYLNQIFQLGDFSIVFHRFFWVVPMHIITMLIMIFTGSAKRWFLIFGFAGALILHLLFNGVMSTVLM